MVDGVRSGEIDGATAMTPIERYHANLRDIGCIVCLMLGTPGTPPEIHHLFDAHERDDRLVCPLCRWHHRGKPRDDSGPGVIGFHPGGERPFRDAYGFGEDDEDDEEEEEAEADA